MAVVINEFEVLESPAAAEPRGEPTTAAPAPLPDPEDLRRLLAQQAERQLRLWAH